ncbi:MULTISPECIES: glycosyltransferase [unclassified Gilliamella]|uniref:glycosyltransferase n=1 Tax=unclassified Gilliamella TaxID=2685620 RepID=UPI00080D9588|nr:glycosyltransferase [Gilliamella apicola]OCG35946.1 hypothetical protein A9G32_06075 [Gilliamella apicola]OCG47080.1 hypothetical protein A9G27_05925 [Gilliamella apicola]OCG48802.1 hypothetical protein A9G26_00690 [Gilliamella apicola]
MINNNAPISIIIPCYNVENYIANCLDSLIHQSCLPEEIICIDDGSTDDTLLIIQKYSSKFDYIRIIRQTNQGVSAARNKGVELATSKYILFIDSDDILNTNLFYQFKYSIKTEPNLNVFYFDYTTFKVNLPIDATNKIMDIEPTVFKSGTELLNYLLEKVNYSGVVWRYIFKRQLFTKKFSGTNHEDHLVSLAIMTNAKTSYYFNNKDAHFHRVRSSSLSNFCIDSIYTETLRNVLKKCIQQINDLPLSDKAKLNYILVMNVTYLETILRSNIIKAKQEKDAIIKELGLLKILIRIYTNNKPNVIRNIFYILKFLKQHDCFLPTKKALLKCAITKRYPKLDIKKNYQQYSSLDKF